MIATELKKYINENDKICFVLEQAGFDRVKDHGEYITAQNPDGDNPSAVNMYKTDFLLYINYTRNVKPDDKQDIFDAVQYAKNIDFRSAIKWLHDLLELPYTYKKDVKQKKNLKSDVLNIFKKYKVNRQRYNVEDLKELSNEEMRDFAPVIHIDIFREGIIKKTIDKFGLSYDYQHKRTVFPMHSWIDGKIIGLNERTSIKDWELLDIKKYFITKGFNKGVNLYGLWENRNEIESQKTVVIVESEKSVCKQDSRGHSNLVALSGHTISKEQVRIILGLRVNEIIIALDKDIDIYQVAGICEKFYGLRKVSFIWDEDDLIGDKDSPADADNRTYQFLMDHRKIYNERLHKAYLNWRDKNEINK